MPAPRKLVVARARLRRRLGARPEVAAGFARDCAARCPDHAGDADAAAALERAGGVAVVVYVTAQAIGRERGGGAGRAERRRQARWLAGRLRARVARSGRDVERWPTNV